MHSLDELSIVICTRNRLLDLEKCVKSVLNQNIPLNMKVELIIIDDGELPEQFITSIHENSNSSIDFIYCKKTNPGLLLSRIKAVEIANYDIILFLDDDVILDDTNYLNELMNTYRKYPEISGLGGIDKSIQISRKRRIITRLIGYDSGKAGKLSSSSYGGSMYRWLDLKQEFYTEFLHGCNMSFKKAALLPLQPVKWLQSYSLAEDIYLSQVAIKEGPLLVNPKLAVQHNHSPVSRDKLVNVSFTEIVNHHYLLKTINANWKRYLAHFYTSLGLYILALFKSPERAEGYRKGIKYLISKIKM
jgi:glycosyltransferase involved in cell wall biosynthesis